jgi:predicted chitinase
MLISTPFLAAPTGDGIVGYQDSFQPNTIHIDDYESPVHGIYPVSRDQCWHGGIHLRQKWQYEPVRAIADGTVVAYRACAGSEDGDDTSFVLLRHETETGLERPIVFYSLYMHLCNLTELNHKDHNLAKAIIARMQTAGEEARQDGHTRIYRKDILGYSGTMHGQRMLHFEIFMTNDDFTAYFDRTLLGKNAITGDGDTELWGDIYYRIPGNAIFHDKADGTGHASEADDHVLYVRVAYDKGARIVTVWSDEGDGQCLVLLTPENGDVEPDYEYTLHDKAARQFPGCASAGYELLRFGRVIGPDKGKLPTMHLIHRPAQDEEACVWSDDTIPRILTPADADRAVDCVAGSERLIPARPENWLLMTYDPTGNRGYIDLNAAAIIKLSDADFPPFMGWAKASEAGGVLKDDGLCDIKVILDLLKDANHADSPPKDSTPEHLENHLRFCEASRKKLRGLVCEAPTEWDKSGNADRYKRLLGQGEFYENNPQGLEEFLLFVEKFQFWDKTGLPGKVWHFHPLRFIEHFKKCGWLSVDEMAQCLPRNGKNLIHWKLASKRLKTNSLYKNLNIVFRKYGLITPERLAAFMGQIYIETGVLETMIEIGHGKHHSYPPFYGRGIMQLTWAANYDAYGKYRQFETVLTYTSEGLTSTSTHLWVPEGKDKNGKIRQIIRQWSPRYEPDIVATDGFAACDSGGFYWITKNFLGQRNINRIADKGLTTSNVGRISVLVNGGGNGYDDRQKFTPYIYRILSDDVDTSVKKQYKVVKQLIGKNEAGKTVWKSRDIPYSVEVDFTAQRIEE